MLSTWHTEILHPMIRENLKTQSSEYIVIYEDELYVASQTPEEISIFYKTNARSISIQMFI